MARLFPSQERRFILTVISMKGEGHLLLAVLPSQLAERETLEDDVSSCLCTPLFFVCHCRSNAGRESPGVRKWKGVPAVAAGSWQ